MAVPVIPQITATGEGDTAGASCNIIENFIFTPYLLGTQIIFPLQGIVGVGNYDENYIQFYKNGYQYGQLASYYCTLTIKDSDNNVLVNEEYHKTAVGTSWSHSGTESVSFTFSQAFPYIIEYRLRKNYSVPGIRANATLIFYVNVTTNRLPLKKWTITDVIVRACDLIEPLRYGEKPRFRLDGVIYDDTTGNATGYQQGSIAEELDKIISPEYAFTKMHFREQMQQVGGKIHAEFRITRFDKENGRRYYTFTFDKYGGKERAVIKDLKKPISTTFKTDINEYCTALDSSTDNLINQIDWAQGVVVEPFVGGGISLRTETTTARMTDDNSSFIPTAKPIYQTGGVNYKVLCVYIPNKGSGEWNISPYIFEKADYDLLSSYSGTYPYCKAYGLYYTQGEPNIKGLFFKAEHAVSSIFNKYAIVNILRAVTGDNNLDISGDDLFKLAFRIEYLPIYGERIRTNKQCIIGGTPRTLAYNQNANLIEARYYGSHLKGVVERLGNVEKTLTYNLAFIGDIPKIGTLYDDNYYIAAVSCEYLQSYIKCTVALSKNFNRRSNYIGLNSEKRMWEVSEKMSVKRDSVIEEYLVFSTTPDTTVDNIPILWKTPPGDILNGTSKGLVSAVAFRGCRKQGINAPVSNQVILPVVASATDNSLIFTFSFADNYSAGQKTDYYQDKDGQGNNANSQVTGRWANFVPYNDYYGRFYWAFFLLLSGNVSAGGTPEDLPSITALSADNVVAGSLVNPEQYLVKYRKDSREAPQISYSLSMQVDDESFILGSASVKNSQFVNTQPKKLRMYFFKTRLNVFGDKPDLSSNHATQYILWGTINNNNIGFTPAARTKYNTAYGNGTYQSWAIVTAPSTKTIRVEDEDGNETTQQIQEGGEIIIGRNGVLPTALFMRIKRRIYN